MFHVDLYEKVGLKLSNIYINPERTITWIEFSNLLSNFIKCVSLFPICYFLSAYGLKRYKRNYNKILALFRKCRIRRNVLRQQQQLLPDTSPDFSFYLMYRPVNNSSEDAWRNCLIWFPSYFTNLSKVDNLLISNFGLFTVISFCSILFHNIYSVKSTSHIK
jgi:hypothetical protein